MIPFDNVETRPFLPGASGAAFVSAFLLPIQTIQGPGNFAGSLQIFQAPMIQAQAVPDAWNGIMSGQFVSQPLTDPNGLSQ